jgi:cytochrome oxidase Cu insertion factor (SCO1/SenC/PrrC family)
MQPPAKTQKLAIAALLATSALVIIVGAIWGMKYLTASRAQPATQPANMALGGFPMPGQLAPDFTLTDQFNHQLTLSSLRGHEVVLAFIDSRCTTLCPLTSNIMYSAKAQLDSTAASKVDLIAVNANPAATSVSTVQSWSIAHGMLNQWSFLTGTSQQLETIYHAYNVYVQTTANGEAEHDALTFIIDAQGHERLYYETLDSNNKVDLKDQEDGMTDGMRQWLPHT